MNATQVSKVNVSGVAIGQWRDITIKGAETTKVEAEAKILRALVLGKPVFVYKSGEVIVRYHNINIMINPQGIITTVWRHTGYKPKQVSESKKQVLKSKSRKELENIALKKFESIMNGEFKIKKQGHIGRANHRVLESV